MGLGDWLRKRMGRDPSLSDDERALARRARNRMLSSVTLLGVVALVLHAAQFASNRTFFRVLAVSFVLAGTALFFGVALGFLFGIPRAIAAPASDEGGGTEASYATNTNLEQVSDWLTKILVGVGLVQIGEIGRAMTGLGDYLAPALGDSTTSAPFAVFTAGYFAVSGFLAGYLWTRIELRQAFESVEGFQERVRAVLKADSEALYLAERQLDVSGASEVSPPELFAAFRKASDSATQQIYAKAWQVRRDNWNWRTEPSQSAKRLERTIPIFRALVDTSIPQYRVLGQLGFALKDQSTPSYAEAEQRLTAAIEQRGDEPDPGYYLYEFCRAVCRIEQDAKYRPTPRPPSDRELVQRVMQDLRVVVAHAPKGRDLVRGRSTPIPDWAAKNNVPLP